jgi:uncharacterized protein
MFFYDRNHLFRRLGAIYLINGTVSCFSLLFHILCKQLNVFCSLILPYIQVKIKTSVSENSQSSLKYGAFWNTCGIMHNMMKFMGLDHIFLLRGKVMGSKRRIFYIVSLVTAGCLIMAWVDAVLSPNYAVKSAIKLILFLLLPASYSLIDKQLSYRSLFHFDRKKLLFSVVLGGGVYVFILGVYFIISRFFDFSKVTTALQGNIGVNKNNFIFVALYISFVNSLLEEFFFRGFAFLTFKKVIGRKIAYLFSAGAFSLYHIAMMTSWFTSLLFLILISGLFAAGLLFNGLNEKSKTLYPSWLVHMCANLAINTIGFMLFGIL